VLTVILTRPRVILFILLPLIILMPHLTHQIVTFVFPPLMYLKLFPPNLTADVNLLSVHFWIQYSRLGIVYSIGKYRNKWIIHLVIQIPIRVRRTDQCFHLFRFFGDAPLKATKVVAAFYWNDYEVMKHFSPTLSFLMHCCLRKKQPLYHGHGVPGDVVWS